MISYAEALSSIMRAAAPQVLSSREVSLEEAIGMRIDSDLHASEPNPLFENSAMDGFAVRSYETQVGALLKVVSSLVAGDAPVSNSSGFRANGVCVEIMTGAPLPDGFDSVIRIEDTELAESSPEGKPLRIRAKCAVKKGENVRRKGEDFPAQTTLLRAGSIIQARDLLALGTAGHSRISVRRRPRVVVVATGNELREVSENNLEPGAIRNSSAPFLIGVLRASGVEASYRGIVRDSEPERLVSIIREVLAENSADVVITTGAVSMGRHDFIPDAVRTLGGERIFHKTAIRPGKPILFSMLGNHRQLAWFGLPGNPISTAVGFRFFVRPYLLALCGFAPEKPLRLPLANAVRKPDGLRCFLMATNRGGSIEVISGQASHKVSPMLQAESWVVLQENGSSAEVGEMVDVYPF